jgi:hypothetical protein
MLWWPELRDDAVACGARIRSMGAGPSAAGARERIVMGFTSREWQEVPVPIDRNG